MAPETSNNHGSVYFVGAGPGDPDLITVKGRRLLRDADVVVYAGSLVNDAILSVCRRDAELLNSAGMALGDITETLAKASREGKRSVRLQTGDPTFYSALAEQAAALGALNIPFEVIPGVSSAFASAAALKKELTVPEVSQTIILTRMEGRTPVPEGEKLSSLASHGATLCIFLSVSMIEGVVTELKKGAYDDNTPISVVYRASWPDEKRISGTLKDIAAKVKEAGITKHAMILVGKSLGIMEAGDAKSKLYDAGFAHEFRDKQS